MARILNLLRHAEGCALALLLLQVGAFAVAFKYWLSLGPVAVGLIAGGLALQRFVASGYGLIAVASPARAAEMRGQTAVVTGANTGIGFETAKSLLHRQVRVVIACRSKARGEEALRRLVAAVPGTVAGQHVRLALVDMESQASVREFATQGLPKCLGVAALADVTVDMLVNNAGLFSPDRTLTKDGVEKVIAVNHVSGFLLTELLIDALKRGGSGRGGRVVCVGSIAHFKTDLDRSKRPRSVADALEKSPTFVKAPYYDLSKLCNLMHAAYLAKEHGLDAFSVHPGGVLTEVFRSVPVIEKVLFTLNKWLLKTPVEGAQTTLHCLYGDVTAQPLAAVPHGSAVLVPGGYYADCRLAEKCRNPATRHPEELKHFVTWSKRAASL
jgi:NAD(P)-dependent dehydrogenase (short-subunit alcohol dehydrogenase family)